MPDAIITSTASTFGTISGTFAADQSTVTGTVTGPVSGTLSGSVGVPGPAGPAGAGVPAGGTAGQYLQKIDSTDYNTDWVTLNLSAYAPLNSPAFTGNPTAPTAALGDNDTSLATTAFVQQELLSGTANAKNLEVYVRNQTGSTLAAGTIVYINGATGNRPTVTPAQANNDANSAQTMGFVKTAIAHNGFGYVIVRGECEALDTSAVAEGTQLYLSPTTAGAYTTTKPSAPQHLVYVGIVIRSHPTQGVILVAVQNGYELNELHDVAITSPTNGQVLKYNSTTGLWYNGTDSAGVAWGGITGTLSAQTDLQTALDGKYSTSNPAGYITSSALTGYATESFVTSQGYITSAALSPYLTSATAASTYQTLAGMSSYLTTSAAASTYLTQSNAASTYYLQTNPAGYITSSALSPYALLAGATFTGKVTTIASTTGTAPLNIPHGSFPTTPTDGDIWTTGTGIFSQVNGSPFQFAQIASPTFSGVPSAPTATAGTSTTQIATTAFVTTADNLKANLASPALTGTPTAPTAAVDTNTTQLATTAYVVGQGYLKSTTASSTYAPLASPALTGTPTAPTASAGTNTTQIATTAFVTAAVPTFATFTTPGVNSTNTIVSPRVAIDYLMHPGRTEWLKFGSTATSGTGASVGTPVSTRSVEIIGPNVGVAGYAMAVWDTSFNGIGMLGMTRGVDMSARAWNKGIWASGRGQIGYYVNNTYNGDANTTVRVSVGGKTAAGSGPISSGEPGFGWLVPGVGNAMQLQVSNGSAVTTVTSSFTPVARQVFDWKMFSDGSGNVTLWINDSVVATTTAGPTTATAEQYNFYFEMVEQTASAGTRILYESLNSRVWWGV